MSFLTDRGHENVPPHPSAGVCSVAATRSDLVLSLGGMQRAFQELRPWRMLFAELGEIGGTSWGVYQAREDHLAFLTGLRPVRCSRFFSSISRTCCEGNRTWHEGLVALRAWKHSFAEERVGVAAQAVTSQFAFNLGGRRECPPNG